MDWGILVPNDNKQTKFVWFDVLLGYSSFLLEFGICYASKFLIFITNVCLFIYLFILLPQTCRHQSASNLGKQLFVYICVCVFVPVKKCVFIKKVQIICNKLELVKYNMRHKVRWRISIASS